jgi:hypothetical protein
LLQGRTPPTHHNCNQPWLELKTETNKLNLFNLQLELELELAPEQLETLFMNANPRYHRIGPLLWIAGEAGARFLLAGFLLRNLAQKSTHSKIDPFRFWPQCL